MSNREWLFGGLVFVFAFSVGFYVHSLFWGLVVAIILLGMVISVLEQEELPPFLGSEFEEKR